MEEIIQTSDEPGVDKVVVFCDYCNTDWSLDNSFVPPPEWCDALSIPRGTVVLRGTFEGTFDDACQQGWKNEEVGAMCPVCQEEMRARDPDEVQVMSLEQALNMLQGRNGTKT